MNNRYIKGQISFVVPCFNGASHVKRFFESLVNQTYHNIQLILVNDGSVDDTDEVINKYKSILLEQNIDLKYIVQENGGMGKAINKALKYISGEFFTWFGIDDYPLPTYCEEAIRFLNDHQDYALVRIDGYYVSERDHSIIEGKVADCNNDKENPHIFWNAVEERNFQFGYSVLRTAVFAFENDGMDIYESYHGQNWQLLLPILYRNKSKFIDKPLYKVIVHENSVSRITNKSYSKRLAQLKEYIKIILTTINKMRYISDEDKEKAIEITNFRYAHRIFLFSLYHSDFNTAALCYKFLKGKKILYKREVSEYRKRFFRVEYWLDLKHKLIK